MPLRADAPVTPAAGHIVVEHAIGHHPGRVLRVDQRVEIDDRRAHGGSDVRRAGVIADDDRRQLEEGCQLGQIQLVDQRKGGSLHHLLDTCDKLHLSLRAGEGEGFVFPHQQAGGGGEMFRRVAARRPSSRHEWRATAGGVDAASCRKAQTRTIAAGGTCNGRGSSCLPWRRGQGAALRGAPALPVPSL